MTDENLQPSDLEARPGATSAIAGLAAGLAMVAYTLAVRVAFGALTITELAADWFTSVLPPEMIDYLLESLSYSAKPLMFAGMLVAQVLVGGLVALAFVAIPKSWPTMGLPGWTRAPLFATALWLVSMLTLVPAFDGGLFGTSAPGGTGGFALASLGAYFVYGVSLAYLLAWIARQSREGPTHPTRRLVIRRIATWAIIGVVLGAGTKILIDRLGSRISTSGAFRSHGALSTLVTPNEEFYIVSKNIFDPEVDAAGWVLEIDGLVEEPMSLTYDDLLALQSVEEFVTLECISNEVGGDLIGNANWKGVALREILQRARLRPGVVDISFAASDGYSESISVDRALNTDVMVAYEMNGEPLSSRHGAPARLIVPGFFGLKSVKWLTKISPVDHDFQGYWQQRGWTDNPIVKTMSRLDVPAANSSGVVGIVDVGGVAFAGTRGISAVEFSLDEGQTWTEAELTGPLSPYTWVIWTASASVELAGEIRAVVRATDGDGNVQTEARQGTLPDGATGHHTIRVRYREA